MGVCFALFCCCSVAKSHPTFCNPMDCSTPGFPVLHSLPEFTETHARRVSDAIQPSHPLSSPSPTAIIPASGSFPVSQLFGWLKYWCFSFSISPSNEYSGLISFRMDWLDLLAVQGTLKSLLQHHSSKASILRCSAFLYSLTLTSIHDYWKNHSFEGQLYTTVVFCADENVK